MDELLTGFKGSGPPGIALVLNRVDLPVCRLMWKARITAESWWTYRYAFVDLPVGKGGPPRRPQWTSRTQWWTTRYPL